MIPLIAVLAFVLSLLLCGSAAALDAVAPCPLHTPEDVISKIETFLDRMQLEPLSEASMRHLKAKKETFAGVLPVRRKSTWWEGRRAFCPEHLSLSFDRCRDPVVLLQARCSSSVPQHLPGGFRRFRCATRSGLTAVQERRCSSNATEELRKRFLRTSNGCALVCRRVNCAMAGSWPDAPELLLTVARISRISSGTTFAAGLVVLYKREIKRSNLEERSSYLLFFKSNISLIVGCWEVWPAYLFPCFSLPVTLQYNLRYRTSFKYHSISDDLRIAVLTVTRKIRITVIVIGPYTKFFISRSVFRKDKSTRLSLSITIPLS